MALRSRYRGVSRVCSTSSIPVISIGRLSVRACLPSAPHCSSTREPGEYVFMKRPYLIVVAIVLGFALGVLPRVAHAATHADSRALAASPVNSGDTSWVLASAALVMLMTPALGFFYGGLVRHKNALSTIMHSFFILCLISVQWVLWGYSLAFGPDHGHLIGGLDWIGLHNVSISQPDPM